MGYVADQVIKRLEATAAAAAVTGHFEKEIDRDNASN